MSKVVDRVQITHSQKGRQKVEKNIPFDMFYLPELASVKSVVNISNF